MSRAVIIAEAGVNHNGNIEAALRLVERAAEIGADCVKFQTFKTEENITHAAPKAAYQLLVTDALESQFDMIKRLELGYADFAAIKQRCDECGIAFMSTPYSPGDVDLLVEIGVDRFKVASAQLVETQFLRYVANTGKQVIVSTGMGNMDDVREAVNTIRATGNEDIVVLQCNTDYPSKLDDANIRAMVTMRDELGVRVGYSDHVQSNLACFAAIALGAEIIEKHFTLDREQVGPDHSSSLDPAEFRELIVGVRDIERSLGDGIKRPSDSELKNMYAMRRSLVATSDLPAGTILSAAHLGTKRPANGLPPRMLDQVVGRRLKVDLRQDQPLTLDAFAD